MPSIYSFTTNEKKKPEQDMERYSAAKCRREIREFESAETLQDFETINLNEANKCSYEANECSDNEKATIVYSSNAECVHTRIDLTVKSLTALVVDYQERMIEASQHQCTKGYPDEDNLKDKSYFNFMLGCIVLLC